MRLLCNATLLLSLAIASLVAGEPDPAFVALAQSIEKLARQQNPAGVAAAYDVDGFCNRLRDGSTDEAYHSGFVSGYKKNNGIAEVMCAMARQGDLSFMRMKVNGTEQRALFRMSGDNGINYTELIFIRDAAGQPKVVDQYIYISGELLSTTLKVIYQNGLRATNPGVFQKIFGNNPIADALPKMQLMNKHNAAGNFQGVVDVYKTIPKELQTWKALMLMRITASSKLNQQLWLEAIQDYERAHPNDTALNFVKVDAFLIQKKWDEALTAVDGLDKAVGGDGFLNTLRGNIQSMAGRHDIARTTLSKAVAEFPNMLFAHACLLNGCIAAKDYPAAVKAVDAFSQKFGWNDAPLQNDPQYADFLASKEYKDWKAKQK